jgi:SAM-dependent methyltransferase
MRLRNSLSIQSPSPKLNIGCGLETPEGFHNIDILPGPDVHTVMDVDHEPFPFESGTITAVLASHVIEHIAHVERLFGEVHRVLKVGGIFEIYVPYGNYGRRTTLGHIRSLWPGMARHLGIIVDPRQRRALPWRLVLSEVSERALPFGWHFKHYFGIEPNFGRKAELHFVLEKESKLALEEHIKAHERKPFLRRSVRLQPVQSERRSPQNRAHVRLA